MNVLIVTSSAQAEASVSSGLAEDFAEALRKAHPAARIIRRDVGGKPIPHLDAATVGAIRGEPATDAEKRTRALSDALIAEVEAADLIAIASPMYNFGISSTLKTWFDHVVRAGVTFRYTEGGPEGLLKDKQAVVIESRAGFYSDGPLAGMDAQESQLRALLGFVGITDVHWVRAEKLASGAEIAEASIAAARRQLREIAGDARRAA